MSDGNDTKYCIKFGGKIQAWYNYFTMHKHKQHEPKDEMDTVLHSWEAREYPHYKKNFAWYVTFLAILVLIIGFQIVQEDIFGAVCLGILGLLTIVFASIPPKMVLVLLTPRGVHMEDLFIPYAKMRHFWIVDDNKHKTLNIETRAFLQKVLVLELHDQDPEKIRSILQQILPELDESEPTMSQKFMHWFKF